MYLADLKAKTMSNIKVGDRVRALVDGGYTENICQPGDIGTVRRVDGEVYGVDFDGRKAGPWNMFDWEIELVQPAQDLTARIEAIEKRLDALCPKPERADYKFGDKVEVLYGGRWWPGIMGDRVLDGRLLVMFQPFGSTSALHFEPDFVRPA